MYVYASIQDCYDLHNTKVFHFMTDHTILGSWLRLTNYPLYKKNLSQEQLQPIFCFIHGLRPKPNG